MNVHLPIRRSLSPIYVLSFLAAALMVAASAAGILYPDQLYPTAELRQTFESNDIVNLIVGLPFLLGSIWLARRGTLIGLLCLPGGLIYVLYNYLAYLFALPFSWGFLLHLALTVLPLYTLVGLAAAINGKAVAQKLSGAVPEKFAGVIIAGFGALFMLRVIAVAISALASGPPLTETDLAASVSDFFISPAMIIGGILLWRRHQLGYVAGLGLLFQACMLFIGLIFFLILQPLLTDAPFALVDVIVVFVMGLVCFVPFALFARGVAVHHQIPSA